ncbi:lysine-sensitive aspartokinase 3 [Sodalis sp. CWE]|uniref:lysine-sensitive aspartokinase 3 n=1 Tax=Sodalis sp. CWE TaxID=2803816 RepID=UPI001C7CC002|nr:lysine-sensitive aspartokinase 3 [Sodalis sp. CWE]MBX4180695.1 lysine-sensitive aspartokinase 3 [Sodalis sp. CWE]
MLIDSATSFQVAKFGGTSLIDFESMNHSANIVLNNPMVRLVVLSASAGITNILIALSGGQKESYRRYFLNKIRQIQYNVIDHLIDKTSVRKKIDQMIYNIGLLAKLAQLKTSLALTDELASHGELMSTLLFVEVLRQRGASATWFDIRKVMLTDNQFGHAKPYDYLLKTQTRALLIPRLKTELIITQGFIGKEFNGRTTTLGRGGSDYTATLLGEAVKARQVNIWTDVPGIYTTDPRIVPQAKRIEKISFKVAAAMAIFGTKFLHPETLKPTIRSAIPIFIGSSKEPNAGGTLVYNYTEHQPSFSAISLRYHNILLILQNFGIMCANKLLEQVLNTLNRHSILVDFITFSKISVSLIVNPFSRLPINDKNLFINSILTELSLLCNFSIEENLAIVTIIGNRLRKINKSDRELLYNTLDKLNIRLIFGASNYNISLLVSNDDAENIVRVLHNSLFR